MFKRHSIVDGFKLRTLSFSSVLEFGDSNTISALSKVYAVQREKELFYTSEGNFSGEVFTSPIPLPPVQPTVAISKINQAPIRVGTIDIIGISSASVVQIGNTKSAYLEARVKNIRQLKNGNGYKNGNGNQNNVGNKY
ncbi:spore germination protein GerPE [Bacillus seohaeanensis]|jgi:spore germination protein PE|uniref:Spore germination protein GerPE n=1 Tax=Bacillus seohaeanensis TaxID=284580 RepID=A0ABW5RRI1_9BACI